MTAVPVITAVELAIVDRLKRGLGTMVRSVETYGGQLDEDLADVVRSFPAAWVTFAGVTNTTATGTSRKGWRTSGMFAVMVGARSVRKESASRHGGPAKHEVGTNQLIYAVRRLLTRQDLGLEIAHLEPGRVRTLHHALLGNEAFSAFALEFHTAWVEYELPNGTFPEAVPAGHPDAVFADYGGELSPTPPDLDTTDLRYRLQPDDGEDDANDQINHRSDP